MEILGDSHLNLVSEYGPGSKQRNRLVKIKRWPGGDMKDMVKHIIADGAPDKLNVKNNKAVAATASLVDFVRMTVLKNYRIYVKRSKRISSHENWMKNLLSDEYSSSSNGKLIAYLQYANLEKKFGVQYVVDGLQGNLLEALALGKKDYLQKLIDMENGKVLSGSN